MYELINPTFFSILYPSSAGVLLRILSSYDPDHSVWSDRHHTLKAKLCLLFNLPRTRWTCWSPKTSYPTDASLRLVYQFHFAPAM